MQNDAPNNSADQDWMGSDLSMPFEPLQGLEGDAEARTSNSESGPFDHTNFSQNNPPYFEPISGPHNSSELAQGQGLGVAAFPDFGLFTTPTLVWDNNFNGDAFYAVPNNNAVNNNPYLGPYLAPTGFATQYYLAPFVNSVGNASTPNLVWDNNDGLGMFPSAGPDAGYMTTPWFNEGGYISGSLANNTYSGPGPVTGFGHFPSLAPVLIPTPTLTHAASTSTIPTPAPALTPTTSLKPHRCTFPTCNKRFKRLSDLRRHQISRHLNVQGYLCPVPGCPRNVGKGYSRPDKVTEHLWRQHADLGYTKA